MKKRILSFVLAAMMVVMVFVIPTTVAGAVSNNYSYKFADTDIRNYVDGQVFDVAAKGESDKAPRMDGVISEGEYAVAGSIPRESNPDKALDSLPISFAVRNGYLYVAFKYEGEKQQAAIQYDIGVLQDHRSDGAYSRKQVTWKIDDTTGDAAHLLRVPGTNVWAGHDNHKTTGKDSGVGKATMDSDYFLVDMKHGPDGTYEAKFDIAAFYNVFENSCRGNDIYDTPCMTIAFFYDVDAKTEVGQTHYAFPIAGGVKIDSDDKVGWAPATVIIPEVTLKRVAKKGIGIGELGTDPRNAIEGQLAKVEKYADIAPVMDGVINKDEYTVVNHSFKTDINKAGFEELLMNYAVSDDGFFYMAFSYKATEHKSIIIQPGISGNNLATMTSRGGVTLNPDGTFKYQNSLFKNATCPGPTDGNYPKTAWNYGLPSGANKAYMPAIACGTSFENGVVTWELKLDIASMVAIYELAGWDADYANCVQFIIFTPNGTKQLGYTNPLNDYCKQTTGVSYTVSHIQPTVELPEGTTTKFHNHVSENVTVLKQNTHYVDGLIEYVCDKCGEKITEIVPRTLDHEFAKPELHNESFHKISCPCGFSYYEDHNWNKGELVKGTIADGRDKMVYTCIDCGEQKEEIVPSTATVTEPTTAAPTTVAPTTEAPTTVAPTTEAPTTVAPTTEAPTTAAPTTATPTKPPATTETEKTGCGSAVALSALALIPMLGAAVVFGKKRED